MAFLGEDIGLEYQPATRHIHVLADHTFQMGLQFVGIVDIPLYVIDVIDGSNINIREHTTDFLVCMKDNAFIARLGLFSHAVLGDQIDNGHDNCCHHNQHRHDP